MTDKPSTGSELILYQTEDDQTRVQCRFEGKLSNHHYARADLEVG